MWHPFSYSEVGGVRRRDIFGESKPFDPWELIKPVSYLMQVLLAHCSPLCTMVCETLLVTCVLEMLDGTQRADYAPNANETAYSVWPLKCNTNEALKLIYFFGKANSDSIRILNQTWIKQNTLLVVCFSLCLWQKGQNHQERCNNLQCFQRHHFVYTATAMVKKTAKATPSVTSVFFGQPA